MWLFCVAAMSISRATWQKALQSNDLTTSLRSHLSERGGGMSLPAVGIDIVEINRLAKQAQNARFLKRVFTAEEVAYCQARKHAAQHLAVRFAAKEAVWKAVGNRKLL